MEKSQVTMVEKRLEKYGEVSRNWALDNYISRLSAIIYKLKKSGYKFKTYTIPCKKPDGSIGFNFYYAIIK